MNSSLANPEFREENASVPDVSRLSGWLHDNIDGFRPPLSVLQIAGGQSIPTFRLTAGSGDDIFAGSLSGTYCRALTRSNGNFA